MRVFKFGGASVKHAQAVKNVCHILQHHSQGPVLVVVSAMGKTTNALEAVLEAKLHQQDHNALIDQLHQEHQEVARQLMANEQHELFGQLSRLFDGLRTLLTGDLIDDHNRVYDSVVSVGELASTRIIAAYLNQCQQPTAWLDARQFVKTDSTFREGKVDWGYTEMLIRRQVPEQLTKGFAITQGFIGSDNADRTTTLGREGSDFTAAIFGTALAATEVVIWKDVAGVLNADPKRMPNPQLFTELPYAEAIEMSYYGATIIHPKTLKPLANRKIPLLVKSFTNPTAAGTRIHDVHLELTTPIVVFKQKQCLFTIKIKDYTFINENILSLIFHVLDRLNIKINMMENSAISFTICIDNQPYKVEQLVKSLQNDFDVRYNEGLELVTIKNYTDELLASVSQHKEVLLEQRSRQTVQLVVRQVAPAQ